MFASSDGRLYVLGLERGEERWSTDLGTELGSSVAVADGWIFVTGLDGRVSAFGPGDAAKEGG